MSAPYGIRTRVTATPKAHCAICRQGALYLTARSLGAKQSFAVAEPGSPVIHSQGRGGDQLRTGGITMPGLAKTLSAIALLIVVSRMADAAAPTCANPVGAWKNHLTSPSTLTIRYIDSTTGMMTGTYRSPSGTTGQDYPMVGWMNQAASAAGKDDAVILSFSVRWTSYGSVTSWTGVCRTTNNKSVLSAMWLLGRPVTDFEWDHVLGGQDIFDPITK
jgi:hypothetical protein